MQVASDSGAIMTAASDIAKILVGALIGFGTTWWFARRAERVRLRGLGYAMVVRAWEATNSILEIRRVLTAKSGQLLKSKYKWQAVQVPTGFDWKSSIVFEPGELAILADARMHALLNELSQLARLHNILNVITEQYAVRRERLTTALREVSETHVDGTTIASGIRTADLAALEPDMMLLEDLLTQLLVKVIEGAEFAKDVSTRLGPAVRKALGDDKFRMRVEFADDPQSVTDGVMSCYPREEAGASQGQT